MKKDLLAVLSLLIFSYWSIRPLLSSGFFPMHDDTQVGRVVAMGRALRHGQFPVRWVADLGYGYGYPIFNFYAPLPYYIGGIFYAAGGSGLTATKLMFGLGIILAGISMYFVAAQVFGRVGGILASLFYLYAPYHAVDIYVRGAVGEFWSLVFLPLVLWSICQAKSGEKKKSILVGGIGLAGVILSHTILGYVTIIFYIFGLAGYSLIQLILRRFDRVVFTYEVMLLVIGLSLAGFFWLPAIFEMQFTNVAAQVGGGADFHDHFVCLPQLWDSPWGYGGSAKGCLDGLSFKLGKLHLLMAVAAVAGWFWQRRRLKRIKSVIAVALATTIITTFLMLRISTKLWEILPNFAYIQYPWRLLAFTTLGLSFLVGGIVFWFKSAMVGQGLVLVLTLSLLVISTKLFLPQYSYARPVGDFESDAEMRWRVSKISDEYLSRDFIRPNTPTEIPQAALSSNTQMSVDTKIDTETYAKYDIVAARKDEIVIRRAYFPGWHYILNGREIEAKIQNGLPQISLPQGRHVFEMRFSDTPVRILGNLISVIAVAALLIIYGKKTHT